MLTRLHIKAARELLGWSQEDCAKHAGVGLETLRRLELKTGQPRQQTIKAVLSALENAGVRAGERGRLTLEPRAIASSSISQETQQ